MFYILDTLQQIWPEMRDKCGDAIGWSGYTRDKNLCKTMFGVTLPRAAYNIYRSSSKGTVSAHGIFQKNLDKRLAADGHKNKAKAPVHESYAEILSTFSNHGVTLTGQNEDEQKALVSSMGQHLFEASELGEPPSLPHQYETILPQAKLASTEIGNFYKSCAA